MNMRVVLSIIPLLFALNQPATGAPDVVGANTDWLREAQLGVFVHYLPGDPAAFAGVDAFDCEHLADQLASMGARYLVLTLGQNSGYMNAPNAAYDRVTGYAAGERCAVRDLPLDLHQALAPRGIRLMLYLPCQVPNRDVRAQAAFGLDQGPKDQPIDSGFAHKWAEVIREWADRYGDKVSGWWFDGAYEHVRFHEEIAQIYTAAVRHGNPDAIVTFNPGVRLIRYTESEDYTAGELNEPCAAVPEGRWVDGSQWHALTYLGSAWGRRDVRFADESWIDWVRAATAAGGAVTLDAGPNYTAEAGPIGSLAEAQLNQVRAIRRALWPERMTRAESFLGIHYDFHAGPDCTEIGKQTTRAMVEDVIRQVQPDYIQIDCKGHRGLSSYPTKVGNQAPGFVGDPLRIWRDVTAEHGVALFMHYSGVWDSQAILDHPDWAVVNGDGGRNPNATSFWSPYAEELLIPQLWELAGDYGVDGAWVDGECWASQPDYGDAALRAFRETTGIQTVPRGPGEPFWYEFLQFHRDAFRAYLRDYIEEVKQSYPAFQLCSNWAFSDHMPEAVCAPVDWISGDYSPQDSLNSARLSGRFMARQGKPWDLMAWSFTTTTGKGTSNQKSVVQLKREAAAVLALGGGFQAYFQQRRDGSIRLELVPVMAEVAKFCRARQEFCHRSEAVPQVALLYSTAAHYRSINGLFNRDLTRLRGTLQGLLESQYSVEVLAEHQLINRMSEYPLIVVPEISYLEPVFRQQLIDYARAGGKLLVIGPAAGGLFARELDLANSAPIADSARVIALEGVEFSTLDPAHAVELGPRGQAIGVIEAGGAQTPAASVADLGAGMIAATHFSFGRGYLQSDPAPMRVFLAGLVDELFPEPLVEVEGSAYVDVALQRIDGRLAVNLVNTSGPHADPDTPVFDEIPAIGPLEIAIRLPERPAGLRLEPGGEQLPFTYAEGRVRATVPELDIHRVLLVD